MEINSLYEEIFSENYEVNDGIHEFIINEHLSVGVSYESGCEEFNGNGYIVNLFIDGDYLNIPGAYITLENCYIAIINELKEIKL